MKTQYWIHRSYPRYRLADHPKKLLQKGFSVRIVDLCCSALQLGRDFHFSPQYRAERTIYHIGIQTKLGIRDLHYCGSICNLMRSRSAARCNALGSEKISFAIFLRIAKAIDPLSMPCRAATGLSQWLLLWECQAAFAALRSATKFRWLFQSFGYAFASTSCRTSTRG